MYGLGNRPGRFDFNSGPPSSDLWPYGRRVTTFPVWAHRHGLSWPEVDFQNGDDDDLSHPANQSSAELTPPYCRPMILDRHRAGTPARARRHRCSPTRACSRRRRRRCTRRARTSRSRRVATIRRRFALGRDVQVDEPVRCGDAGDAAGRDADDRRRGRSHRAWRPATTCCSWRSRRNTTSTRPTTRPATRRRTDIPFNNYGVPYRGQPSIVYQVPFTIGTSEDIETTQSYAGYGDPTGATGTLNPPDSTITTDTPRPARRGSSRCPGPRTCRQRRRAADHGQLAAGRHHRAGDRERDQRRPST